MATSAHLFAPAPAGVLTRAAATFLDIAIVLLLGLAVQSLVRQPLDSATFNTAALLATATIRSASEAVWGSSPGKWLAGIRVKFPAEPRWMRLPQTLLRNSWLWVFTLVSLFGYPVGETIAAAVAVGMSILLGPDRRSFADMIAGAFVIDPKAERRVPDPIEHVPPRRAMAWLVDMGLAGLTGWALSLVTGWPVWTLGLVVLAVLKCGAEFMRMPTPGKAMFELAIDYESSSVPRWIRVAARNLWLMPALLLAGAVGKPVLLVEGFIALTYLYLPANRSVTDLLAHAQVFRERRPGPKART